MIGWREWLELPDLSIPAIKAKIDTGARTSALHALDIESFQSNQTDFVRFVVQPLQYNDEILIPCHAQVKDRRMVTDSGGHKEERYIIESSIQLGELTINGEISLTNRVGMRFKMLLGRTSMDNPVVVKPTGSYQLGTMDYHAIYNFKRKKKQQ